MKSRIMIIVILLIIIYGIVNPNPYWINRGKTEINNHILEKWKLEHYNMDNITYPCVLKPNHGCKGKNVYLIKNRIDLKKYLKKFNKNQEYFLQEYWGDNEAGIYILKYPWSRDSIIYVTKKSPKFNSHCGIYKNSGCKPIVCSPYLKKCVEKISHHIPNFYVGRYDVRYYGDDEELQKGNFKVVELNTELASDERYSYLNNIKGCIKYIFQRLPISLYNYKQFIMFAVYLFK